jgi:hypothetical protein
MVVKYDHHIFLAFYAEIAIAEIIWKLAKLAK